MVAAPGEVRAARVAGGVVADLVAGRHEIPPTAAVLVHTVGHHEERGRDAELIDHRDPEIDLGPAGIVERDAQGSLEAVRPRPMGGLDVRGAGQALGPSLPHLIDVPWTHLPDTFCTLAARCPCFPRDAGRS